MKDQTKHILNEYLTFEAKWDKANKSVREAYINAEPELLQNFRYTIDGLILKIISNLFGEFNEPSDQLRYELDLITSFIKSHFIINDLVFSGHQIEAYTLTRKQLEVLTRLIELETKSLAKLEKRTPNVNHIFGEVGKSIYPDLSETAHFASPRVGQFISGQTEDGKSGPTLYPQYSPTQESCYKRHAFISIYFLFWLIEFVSTKKDDYDFQNDLKSVEIVEQMALDLDIIRTK